MTNDEIPNDEEKPRFAILIHDHPFVHWDLLLESGETARTWRLLESPDRWLSAALPVSVIAEPIADHRLMYLDYEGPISQERGRVARWDSGTFDWQSVTSPVQVRLNGHKLKVTLTLTETRINLASWRALSPGLGQSLSGGLTPAGSPGND